MKVQFPHQRSIDGNTLMLAMGLAACVGIVLVACLSLVKSQNQAVARSQAWNACIPIIEAGIEEAMAHLNNQNESSFAVNGWSQSGNTYSRSRSIGDGFYDVNITLTNLLQPVIVCTGYYRSPVLIAQVNSPVFGAAGVDVNGMNYLTRTVEAVARKQSYFTTAMVARERIVMNGNNIETDSFDSTDPAYSTPLGYYDPAKAKDNGDVATLAGEEDIIGVGNANIKGRVKTGPGGTVSVGASGVVGSIQWHDGGNSGIQPGWWADDMNLSFSQVPKPSLTGSVVPISGTVTGTVFKYLLGGGKFNLPSLNISSKERIAITAPSILVVDGDVDIKGAIDILPGGSLHLYVAGNSTSLGGTGINHTGYASNFVYFGLATNTKLSFPANGDFTGAIYAPNAHFDLSGGGSTVINFSGACLTRTITVNGHYKFHYDEALGRIGPWKDYVIVSWVEL